MIFSPKPGMGANAILGPLARLWMERIYLSSLKELEKADLVPLLLHLLVANSSLLLSTSSQCPNPDFSKPSWVPEMAVGCSFRFAMA